MKSSLFKNSYRLGYNTRDNPHDLPTEACQSLVNLFPGAPLARPRGGITSFNDSVIPFETDDVIPWPDVEIGDRLLVRIDDSWYHFEAGVGPLQPIGSGFPVNATIGWARVRDAVYIVTDDESAPGWIIQKTEPNTATFELRRANIARPGLTMTLTRTGAGNITASKFVNVAVTFIRRKDADSQDANGDPVLVLASTGVFHPGVLESVDRVTDRKVFTDGTVGGSTMRVQVVTDTALDTQVTHMRVYRTEEANSSLEAQGLTLRWAGDVPVKGPFSSGTLTHTFSENMTTATVAGILDTLKTVGYTSMPPGKFCFYHLGRLWVGGQYSGEKIGRWFYSELPLDVEYPQKWTSMFKEDELFKDIALDASEDSQGIDLSGNDLYFFGRRTLWFLRDGDPDFEPILVEGSWGTSFPKSITRIGNELYYLSNVGPARVANRQVEPLKDFTASEVWPTNYAGLVGALFALETADRAAIRGFYYADTWWLGDSSRLLGYHMPMHGQARGPLQIQPGLSNMFPTHVAVLSDTCILIYANSSRSYFWKFLDTSTQFDGGNCYTMKGRSKAYYVNEYNPEQSAELFDILFHARWTDASELNLRIIGDFFRFNTVLSYAQWDPGDGVLVPTSLDDAYRQTVQQGFAEGLFARSFEVEWIKQNKPPFDFQTRGFTLRIKRLKGYGYDFVGGNLDVADLVRKINDAGEVGDDRTSFDLNDAGDESRDLCDFTIKDAQVRS